MEKTMVDFKAGMFFNILLNDVELMLNDLLIIRNEKLKGRCAPDFYEYIQNQNASALITTGNQ